MHKNLVKFGCVVFELHKWIDLQTDRHTMILHNASNRKSMVRYFDGNYPCEAQLTPSTCSARKPLMTAFNSRFLDTVCMCYESDYYYYNWYKLLHHPTTNVKAHRWKLRALTPSKKPSTRLASSSFIIHMDC